MQSSQDQPPGPEAVTDRNGVADPAPRRLHVLLSIAFLAAVFGLMLRWTWFGWPDPVVDFGRELYLPWQITQGRVLYRDLAHLNGPFSVYFNALVFKLLGVSLRSIVISNLLWLAALTAMLFQLIRGCTDLLTAMVACTAQLTIFSFIQLVGIGNYNFITPYSNELTHGITLSVAALLTLQWALTSEHPKRWTMICGLLVGLVLLTKIEAMVAIVGAIGFTLILARFHRWYWFALGAIVPPILACIAFACAMPIRAAVLAVVTPLRYALNDDVRQMPFYREMSGLLNPAESMTRCAISAAIMLAIVAGIWSIAKAARQIAILVFIIELLGCVVIYATIDRAAWPGALVGLPIILAIGVLLLSVVCWRRRDPRAAALLAFTLFALLLTGKIALRVHFSHYGFALAMPAMLAAIALLMGCLPAQLTDPSFARLTRWMMIPPILLVIAAHLRPYAMFYSRKPVPVAFGADQFFGGDYRSEATMQVLTQLQQLPSNATLAVIPEGIMLNFLSRRPSPLPYTNLLPPEMKLFGKAEVLKQFQQHPPDYIIWLTRSDPSGYGYRRFDLDYGADVAAWIAQNYEPINNPTPAEFPLRLVKRRESIGKE